MLYLLYFCISLSFAWGKEDLCPSLPVKVQFYKGAVPSDELFAGNKFVEQIFKGISEGLVSVFQKRENFTFPDNFNFSSIDYSDFNQQPQVIDDDGPHLPSEADFEEQPPAKPNNDIVAKDQPAIPQSSNAAKKFGLPEIVKNVFPSVKIDVNGTNNLEEKLGAGQGVTVPSFLASFQSTGETATDTWGISLPANTIKAELAKIDGDVIREITVIDKHTFQDANKTTNDTSKFLRHVSLADLDIKEKDLLIVCLSMAIVKNDKQTTCQRCLLMRMCQELDLDCSQKFLKFQAADSQVQPKSVSLQYFVDQPPLHGMKFVARLSAKPADQRCESPNDSQSAVEKSGTLFPQTVTYLDIANLSPKYAYTVQVDLNINFSDKTYQQPFKSWPNPLVIQDYLESNEQQFVVPACQAGKKTS